MIERSARKQSIKTPQSKAGGLRLASERATSSTGGLRLALCWRCRAEVKGEGYYAMPCSHGPFCAQCKGLIVREARGTFCLCPVCKEHPAMMTKTMGVITEWEVGTGESIKGEAPAARQALQ